MSRHPVRKGVKPRDGRAIPDGEWRIVIDLWLLGRTYSEIATTVSREESAVRHLLRGKIPINYTEGGIRESPVHKLLQAQSVLDPDREPTHRDLLYFTLLRKNKRTPEQCAVIMHLPLSAVRILLKKYGLPKMRSPSL